MTDHHASSCSPIRWLGSQCNLTSHAELGPQNIGLVGYCRETDCPADSGQLVMSGKLLEIFTKRTFYFTSFRCRRDMFLFIFLKWFWCVWTQKKQPGPATMWPDATSGSWRSIYLTGNDRVFAPLSMTCSIDPLVLESCHQTREYLRIEVRVLHDLVLSSFMHAAKEACMQGVLLSI